MKNLRRMVSVFLLALMLIVNVFPVNAGTSEMAADTTAPTVDLSTLEIDKKNVRAGETVSIKVKAWDDMSSVYNGSVLYMRIGATQYDTTESISVRLEYDRDTGYLMGNFEVPDTNVNGTYEIAMMSVTDYSNNNVQLQGVAYDFSGGTFTFSGGVEPETADTTPPTIDAASLEISKKNITPGETVSVKIKAEDNASGVSGGYISYLYENGFSGFVAGKIVSVSLSYNEESGYLEGSFSMDDTKVNGLWKVFSISVTDKNSNTASYSYTSMHFSAGAFTFSGGAEIDTTAPEILIDTLEVQNKKVTSGDEVNIGLRVVDEETGVDSVYISYKKPLTDRTEQMTLLDSDGDGFFTCQKIIAETEEYGEWKLVSVGARNEQGNAITIYDINDSSTSEDENRADLSAGTFTVYGTSPDMEPPKIDYSTITVNRKTATVGDEIRISLEISDASTIQGVYVNFCVGNADSEFCLLGKNVMTGKYEGGFTISESTYSGEWKINAISAQDSNWNSVSVYNKNGYRISLADMDNREDLSAGDFTVYGTSYVAEPAIEIDNVVMKTPVNTSHGVYLTWEKVDEANTFYIYRRTSSTEWENIGAVSYAYYFVDQEASEGEVYEYAVRASSQGYYSASYDSKKITCIRTLDKVELGSFSNTEYGVRLTWEAVPGADSYQISRRTIDGEWEVIAPSVRRTVFTDTDVENGERYYYAVRGVNGMVVSTEATTSRWIIYRRNNQLPDVNLGTFYNTAVGPRIMWESVDGAAQYRVYRKADGDKNWELLTRSATGTQYVDKTANPYTTYYYTVRAVNGSVISSGYDSTKKIKCVKALQNVTLGKFMNTSEGVQITWTGVGDAKRYRVYRKIKGGEWVMLDNSVTGTSYLDTTAQADTIYYYTVRAVNGEILSPGYDSSRWIMCRR